MMLVTAHDDASRLAQAVAGVLPHWFLFIKPVDGEKLITILRSVREEAG